MTSDSDDLEQQLRENLKLRLELAAEVAKAKNAKQGGSAWKLLRSAAAAALIVLIAYGVWLTISGTVFSVRPLSKSFDRLQGDGLQKPVGTTRRQLDLRPKR